MFTLKASYEHALKRIGRHSTRTSGKGTILNPSGKIMNLDCYPAEELANILSQNSPKGLDKVYFVSSGSEAVEASLKLAKQYFNEIGKPGKHKVISRRQSYHGNTLGALAAGGNLWRRNIYLLKVNLK